RGEKHPKHVAVLIREHAELAGFKTPGELSAAGRTREPGQREALTADRTVERRPSAGGTRGHTACTRTSPIVQSQSSVPDPDPTITTLPEVPGAMIAPAPSIAISPMVVRVVMRTLDPFSRLTFTDPMAQLILLAPESMRPLASMFPARVTRFRVLRKSSTSQLPALTSAVIGP